MRTGFVPYTQIIIIGDKRERKSEAGKNSQRVLFQYMEMLFHKAEAKLCLSGRKFEEEGNEPCLEEFLAFHWFLFSLQQLFTYAIFQFLLGFSTINSLVGQLLPVPDIRTSWKMFL